MEVPWYPPRANSIRAARTTLSRRSSALIRMLDFAMTSKLVANHYQGKARGRGRRSREYGGSGRGRRREGAAQPSRTTARDIPSTF
ncbi:hypothetical protein GCM10010519_48180 [Streptomyces lactacystinicus]